MSTAMVRSAVISSSSRSPGRGLAIVLVVTGHGPGWRNGRKVWGDTFTHSDRERPVLTLAARRALPAVSASPTSGGPPHV
jgi:hypothetical protein